MSIRASCGTLGKSFIIRIHGAAIGSKTRQCQLSKRTKIISLEDRTNMSLCDASHAAMKPLIVGMAPSKGGDPLKPIEGSIGVRLADCCGLTLFKFLETFDRVNLTGAIEQHSAYLRCSHKREANHRAFQLVASFEPGQLVLLLGKHVAAAFKLTDVVYFDKVSIGNNSIAYVVPHPSSINRWWNDPENELQMMRFMQGIVKELRG